MRINGGLIDQGQSRFAYTGGPPFVVSSPQTVLGLNVELLGGKPPEFYSEPFFKDVSQSTHGFSIKDVVRFDTSQQKYVKALADSEAHAEVMGIVERVADGDHFTLVFSGPFSTTGLTPGSVYYLSPATPGAITALNPTGLGLYRKAVLFAFSATAAQVYGDRARPIGAESGGGTTGPQGTTGIRGLNGQTGLRGPTGLRGQTGIRGTTGPGYIGSDGTTGLRGPTGIRGIQGQTGPQGLAADAMHFRGAIDTQSTWDGLTPANGDFYTVTSYTAISKGGVTGLSGDEVVWSTSQAKWVIVGRTPTLYQGETGIRGLQGITGLRGITGARGATGVKGPTGARGATGPVGLTGIQGPGVAAKETLTQASHGFTAGDTIRRDSGGSYIKALADTPANAEAVGIVESVNGNNFTVVYEGRINGLSGFTDGTVYRLSNLTAGLLVSTDPPVNSIDKPMLVATSTTSGIIINMRGNLIEYSGQLQALGYYKPSVSLSQTVFNTPWSYETGANRLWLWRNGALLVITTDYSETSTTSVTLTRAITTTDEELIFLRMPNGEVPLLRSVEANTAGSGSPNLLSDQESSKVLTNEGSTAKNYHTLPTAVTGLTYTFYCQDSDGIRITAAAGDTVRMVTDLSATAGYTESTAIGSFVTLVAINATEWVAISVNGTWTTV